MKKLSYIFAALVLAISASGQPSIGPASVAEVQAGTVRNKFVSPYTLANSGTITNGQTNANLRGVFSGLIKNKNPRVLYAFGDSLSVQLLSGGWKSYGGYTNNSISSANTNQADGAIFYAYGSYTTNESYLNVLTNLLGGYGYNLRLDTAGCVSGQAMFSIWGGLAASNSIYQAQAGYISASSYNANGETNLPLIQDDRELCYWPGSTNDTGFVYGGTTNFVNYGGFKVFGGYSRGSGPHYSAVKFLGTPGSNNTARVTIEVAAGGQSESKYAPPYNTSNANIGTNNIPPLMWGWSNAPVRTGIPAAAWVMAGGNDTVYIGATNGFPGWVTNKFSLIYSNQIAACAQLKSWGFYPVILAVYPLNYNFFNYTNSGDPQAYKTWGMNWVADMTRRAPASAVDIIFDMHATNAPFYSTSANYTDGTHPTTTFARREATNVIDGLDWRYLQAP